MILDVSILPVELKHKPYKNELYVVVDILRATSFMAHAFMLGVTHFELFTRFEDAFDRFIKISNKSDYLLAGERQGKKIPNFHLGNSLTELDEKRDDVFGKTLLFSTTNGTRAFNELPELAWVVSGAFLNLTSVIQYIMEKKPDKVHVVCAGTMDLLSLEDLFFAAFLVQQLKEKVQTIKLLDGARLANDWLNGFLSKERWFTLNQENICKFLSQTMHGKFLIKQGFEEDLRRCSKVNESNVVPVFNSISNSVGLVDEA